MSGYIGRLPVASEPERRQTRENRPCAKHRRLRGALACGVLLAAALALGGCGQNASMNPVRWWQGLQGGALAQQRPPPPGADMPYPNLGSVPKKPAMPNPAARQKVFSALATDRANAQYEAKLVPIPVLPHAAPKPGLSGGQPGGTAETADQSAASASLDAVTAPPRPAGPAAKPGSKAAAAGPPALPPMTPINTGPMPEIPLVPPPPPSLSGYVIPLTRPTPPPVAPPEAKADKLTGSRGQPVALGFLPNSAVLTPADMGALKALAAKRGAHKVEAVGFGDADDATPQVQAEGIDLALARARAITAALNTDGVPPQAVRMSAKASGRGGAARLID